MTVNFQTIQWAMTKAAARLKEPSTYVAAGLLCAFFHVPLSVSQLSIDGEFVRQIIVGVSGLLGVVLAEKGTAAISVPDASIALDRATAVAN